MVIHTDLNAASSLLIPVASVVSEAESMNGGLMGCRCCHSLQNEIEILIW